MPAIVKLQLVGAEQKVENAASIAIRMMMEDVHSLSNPITPKKEGTLRASVSKQMAGPLLGIMKWHAPYAEYQERGYGKYPFIHYTTPGTHAHFIEESVNQSIARFPQYIKMGGLV